MNSPKYDLSKIKFLVEKFLDGSKNLIIFSAPSKSTRCVIEIFLCNSDEAEHTIAKGILQLEDNDFSHRLYQWDTTMDVYGLENYKEANWYIKFNLIEDGDEIALENISFHPNDRPLLLIDGRTLKPSDDL